VSATVLEGVTTVLLVDWPEKAVPEAWVRAGYETHSHEGPEPDEYYVYVTNGDEIAMTKTGRAPDRIDLVYTYRPADELEEIVEFAKARGARIVWFEVSRANQDMADDARAIVERAGLAYVDEPVLDVLGS
jgi:hypothetical protein